MYKGEKPKRKLIDYLKNICNDVGEDPQRKHRVYVKTILNDMPKTYILARNY